MDLNGGQIKRSASRITPIFRKTRVFNKMDRQIRGKITPLHIQRNSATSAMCLNTSRCRYTASQSISAICRQSYTLSQYSSDTKLTKYYASHNVMILKHLLSSPSYYAIMLF